jgi:hypothetical protein
MTYPASTTYLLRHDGIERGQDKADSPPRQPDVAPPKEPQSKEPNVWLRDGPDAPDAADIEDPTTQL